MLPNHLFQETCQKIRWLLLVLAPEVAIYKRGVGAAVIIVFGVEMINDNRCHDRFTRTWDALTEERLVASPEPVLEFA